MIIKKLINKIKNNNFITSVLTLVSGIVIAQGINFVGIPVLARLYTPEAIGDYTLITSSSSIIMSVACLGMMTVFLLPKSDEEARGLVRLVSASTVSVSAIIVIGLFLLSDLFKLFSTEGVSYSISLLVLWSYVIFYTVNNICYAYANRRKLYKVMFWNPIIGASANVGVGVVFGLLDFGFLGYTGAHIIGLLLNIILLSVAANPFEKIKNPSYKMKPLLKSYSRFPKYQMPANIISTFATQMPIQMIGIVFGGTSLGIYAMCYRILSLPNTLLATPINRVYFKEASDKYNNNENIGDFTFKILKANIKLALIPIVVLTIFGEEIFALFLGEPWRQAGEFASILGLYELMLFCSACVSGGFIILGKNKINVLIAVITFCTNLLIFIAAYNFFSSNIIIVVWILSITGTINRMTTMGIFLKMANVNMVSYLFFLLKYVLLPYSVAYVVKLVIF